MGDFLRMPDCGIQVIACLRMQSYYVDVHDHLLPMEQRYFARGAIEGMTYMLKEFYGRDKAEELRTRAERKEALP